MKLLTLGPPALHGATGRIEIDDPRLLALLVILGVSAENGVEADALMLLLTPDATPDQARNELARLLAEARSVTADPLLITHPGTRYALRGGAIELDVDALPADTGTAEEAFFRGFSLPDSPEFGEWLDATRRRIRPREAPPPATAAASVGATRRDDVMGHPTPARSRRMVLVATLVIAVIGVAAAVRLSSPRVVPGFSAGDPVLLADLANETGDTLFDRSILYAAGVSLQQSGHLRLYPRSRLAAVYQRMQITNRDTALTYELAREVAERDGVRFVAGLRLFRDAGGYRVAANLADVQRNTEIALRSEPAEREADVLIALDRVLVDLRERLGESRSAIDERRTLLPQVTTASLEALRSYAEGSAAWNRGNFTSARELYHRAVDLDTGFAMALGALGNWYYYFRDRAEGERYYTEALRRAGRLTERERLRLTEGVLSYRGLTDSAIAINRTMAERFPSVDTWYNYGTELLSNDRDEEALVALRKALTFDSQHVSSYLNMATAAKGLQRNEEALAFYARAAAIDSVVPYRSNINGEWGGTFVRLGQLDRADSMFHRLLRSTMVADRGGAARSLGYLALWRGRLGQSIDYFGQAVAASQQTNAGLTELRNRLLLATALHVSTRTAEANAELTRAMSIATSSPVEPAFLAIVAMTCHRLGRSRDVETLLGLVRSRTKTDVALDRRAERIVAATVALSRHLPDSALRLLAPVDSAFLQPNILMLRAAAWRALSHADSGRAMLERLMKWPAFGAEGQVEMQEAPFVLAELLESTGDASGAADAYRVYLSRWPDAPAALPRVALARRRITELERKRE